MKKINNKRIILSILLVIALVGAGATIALSLAETNPVVNRFEVADHNTDITEVVKGLTKKVSVTNSAQKSPAYIRVRFEISPSDAVGEINSDITWDQNDLWVNGNDGFYYYLKLVRPGESTAEINWQVKDKNQIKVDTFDVLVYEESCVAPSGSDEIVKLDTIKEAFKTADGKDTTK